MSEVASVYVYGVTDAGADLVLEDRGLGPVRMVAVGEIAALCTDVGEEPLGRRRELKAHAEVLSSVCEQAAVVPFTFGTVLPDEDAVCARLLEAHAAHLEGELDRLREVVQFNLRLVPDEQRLLADVVAGTPDLARLNDQVRRLPPGAGQAQRLRLGEAVARAYRDAAARLGEQVLQELGRSVADATVEYVGSEEGATAAALLVRRQDTSTFLAEIDRLAGGLGGRFTFRLVGPLAPFAFVRALPSVDLEAAWA